MILNIDDHLAVTISGTDPTWSPSKQPLEDVLRDVFARRDRLTAELKRVQLVERHLLSLHRRREEER